MIINKIQESCARLLQKKPFGSLLDISPTDHIFLKTFNSELQTITKYGSQIKIVNH